MQSFCAIIYFAESNLNIYSKNILKKYFVVLRAFYYFKIFFIYYTNRDIFF